MFTNYVLNIEFIKKYHNSQENKQKVKIRLNGPIHHVHVH